MSGLELPPYLIKLRDRLREGEPGRWAWFASDNFADEYAESVRLQLLQSTYRMEEASQPALYGAARKALTSLQLDVPVTFYQAQDGDGMNASLCFVPGEVHIVLRGPVLATLREGEIVALVGHEIAHYALWTADGGSLRIAREVIESIASHGGAQPSHIATAERARRYTEIYADRGACVACGDPRPVIACIVKVQTGLAEVDAESYLRQADEIFAKKSLSSEGATHPETFIRARAILMWHERRSEAEQSVAAMLQGPLSIDSADLLDQAALTAQTRVLLAHVLGPAWFRTDVIMAHARAFFPDLHVNDDTPATLSLATAHASIAEYAAYVLLDFAVVDESLGEIGLAHAITLAEQTGIADVFDKIARDELKMTKRALDDIRKQAHVLLERAADHSARNSAS